MGMLTVYLDREHINYCFSDEDSSQIAPISLFIHTNDLSQFLECLEEQADFKFEQHQSNEALKNYHFQLHPLGCTQEE